MDLNKKYFANPVSLKLNLQGGQLFSNFISNDFTKYQTNFCLIKRFPIIKNIVPRPLRMQHRFYLYREFYSIVSSNHLRNLPLVEKQTKIKIEQLFLHLI